MCGNVFELRRTFIYFCFRCGRSPISPDRRRSRGNRRQTTLDGLLRVRMRASVSFGISSKSTRFRSPKTPRAPTAVENIHVKDSGISGCNFYTSIFKMFSSMDISKNVGPVYRAAFQSKPRN